MSRVLDVNRSLWSTGHVTYDPATTFILIYSRLVWRATLPQPGMQARESLSKACVTHVARQQMVGMGL